jgi:hypothetical protein
MVKPTAFRAFRDARDAYIDQLIAAYSTRLFGTPPKRTSTGKLTGATPPDVALLTKLFKL